MAHVVAGVYAGTIDAAGALSIANVNVGTGAGRAIQITVYRARGDRITGITSGTIGGEALTMQGSDTTPPNNTNGRVRSMCRINPTVTGLQTLALACAATGSGSSDAYAMVEVIDGIDTGQAAPTPVVNTGTTATATATVASAVGRQVVFTPVMVCDTVGMDNAVATGFTAPAENGNPLFGGGLGFVTGYAAGAASVAPEAEFRDTTTPVAGTNGWVATGTDWLAPSAGPTIDTQPQADTVLINGDPSRASASFTVAATTSGGALSYQWELETSVGGGVYANVADGSGATWAGATTANLTGTFTAKTLTGRRVRCVVTDSNGSTTTNAVALTVYTGPVLSKASGTTNASGVDTLTITSDYPNADGEFTVVTATAGAVSKQVSLHYEVP